jgi:hypothetical protein
MQLKGEHTIDHVVYASLSREQSYTGPKPAVPRDIFTPDLHIDTLNVKARNFQ